MHATTYATGLTHAAAFAFDGSGRLWVATAAYEDGGDDALYVVAAAGAAPKKVVSGMHTPLGLLWVDGALYVSSHERVDAYRDFDGTTFASSANIVTFPAGVGENNGLVRSPDGRILVGISAPCDACTPASEYSAAIVSFAPDGTDLRVDASGIRAPIGLAYYPGTSDLFVTMNQRDDLGDKTPGDWLAVVTEGSQWGFPDCYGQASDACSSVPAPVATLDKHAAVSGVAIVTGELGRAVGDAAITAEWAAGQARRGGADAVRCHATPARSRRSSPGSRTRSRWSSGPTVRSTPATGRRVPSTGSRPRDPGSRGRVLRKLPVGAGPAPGCAVFAGTHQPGRTRKGGARHMRPKLSHMAAAAAIAGFLGFGGMSLAYAQDSGTSGTTGTTTENPSTTAPAQGSTPAPGTDHQGGCPNMGGSSSGSSSSGSSSTEGSSL